TTLRQDSREIGRQAAQLLLGIIRDPMSPARQIYLPGTVVEGESVSRLNA
ncbi:MAG: LacI family transcriptional regulator, partial [Clostridiales bacterium]|nr:LacI family transcriptional regulator [Clostridiales bacterium]